MTMSAVSLLHELAVTCDLVCCTHGLDRDARVGGDEDDAGVNWGVDEVGDGSSRRRMAVGTGVSRHALLNPRRQPEAGMELHIGAASVGDSAVSTRDEAPAGTEYVELPSTTSD